MSAPDDQLRHLLDDLGRALAEAIASSSDVAGIAARLRRHGYSLNLILNCARGDKGSSDANPLVPAPILRHSSNLEGAPGNRPAGGDASGDVGLTARRAEQPAFRLNAHDVGFLKALGIDGTRPPRRQRGSR